MRQREAGRLRAKLRPWSKEQTVEDHWSNRCSVMTLSFWAEHLYLIPLLIPFLSPKDHTSTSLSTRHLTSTLEKVSALSPGDRLNVFLARVSTLHFDSGVQGEKKELPIHLLITNCLSWLSVVRIKIPYQGKLDSWKTMQNSHPCSIRAECSVTSKSYTYSKLAVHAFEQADAIPEGKKVIPAGMLNLDHVYFWSFLFIGLWDLPTGLYFPPKGLLPWVAGARSSLSPPVVPSHKFQATINVARQIFKTPIDSTQLTISCQLENQFNGYSSSCPNSFTLRKALQGSLSLRTRILLKLWRQAEVQNGSQPWKGSVVQMSCVLMGYTSITIATCCLFSYPNHFIRVGEQLSPVRYQPILFFFFPFALSLEMYM